MTLVVSAISVVFVVLSNTLNCISLSTYDSPFLKSGIFLQTLTLKITLGRFIIYVESGSGEREGQGASAVVSFFLPVQFLEAHLLFGVFFPSPRHSIPHQYSQNTGLPLLLHQTKTRHSTLNICLYLLMAIVS